jgi:formate/nitrite transporter FocA (FNT family)
MKFLFQTAMYLVVMLGFMLCTNTFIYKTIPLIRGDLVGTELEHALMGNSILFAAGFVVWTFALMQIREFQRSQNGECQKCKCKECKRG